MLGWLRGLVRPLKATPVATPSHDDATRQALSDLQRGSLPPNVLFPRLAAEKRTWFTSGHPGNSKPAAFATVQGRPFGMIFSDHELATRFMAGSPLQPQETDGYAVLQMFLRAQVHGLIINPGTEKVMLDHNLLRLLFREYAMAEATKLGGAWVPARDGSLLVVGLEDGVYTVPFYLSEADAQAVSQREGGAPSFVAWQQIRDRCREARADAAFLGYGFPEGVGVTRRQIGHLCNDGWIDPLDKLEDEVSQSLGIANAGAIMQAMAELEYIWALVDDEGAVVQFGETATFFTSCGKAQDFISQMKAEGKAFAMPFPAAGLFRALAPSAPPVAINKGSEDSWIGFGDTLPRVVSMLPN